MVEVIQEEDPILEGIIEESLWGLPVFPEIWDQCQCREIEGLIKGREIEVDQKEGKIMKIEVNQRRIRKSLGIVLDVNVKIV